MWTFILTAISLFCAIGVYGEEVGLDSPGGVDLNQEFDVRVYYMDNDTYDVKIVVQSISDKKSLSEVYSNSKWTSSFYFIIGAYPETKIFKVRVKTYSDNAEICVKLRRTSDKKGQKETCKPVKIEQSNDNSNTGGNQNNSNDQNNQTGNQNNSGSSEQNDDEDETTTKINTSSSANKNYENFVDNKKASDTNQKIFLGYSENIDNKKETLITKEEKIRQGVVYSFAALCILLIILMSFNRL